MKENTSNIMAMAEAKTALETRDHPQLAWSVLDQLDTGSIIHH